MIIWPLVRDVTLVLNEIPAFMPPTWSLLGYFRLRHAHPILPLAAWTPRQQRPDMVFWRSRAVSSTHGFSRKGGRRTFRRSLPSSGGAKRSACRCCCCSCSGGAELRELAALDRSHDDCRS